MKLDNIISVTGLPGLYRLMASRPNGLLIEGLDNKKRQFVSARKHQFTPLVSVGIYTYMDTIPLDDVLQKVQAFEANDPLPDVNDKADTLRSWFKGLVPEHDEDKVHINDIRKLLKWYNFLKAHAWEEVTSDDTVTDAVTEDASGVKADGTEEE